MQRGKHCSEFRGLVHEFQGEILLQEVEIARKKNLVFQFSARAEFNANEVGVSALRLRPTPSTMLEATEIAARRI